MKLLCKSSEFQANAGIKEMHELKTLTLILIRIEIIQDL